MKNAPSPRGAITNIIRIGEASGIIGLVKDEAAILTDLRAECGICAFIRPFVSIVDELPNGGYETGNIMRLSKR